MTNLSKELQIHVYLKTNLTGVGHGYTTGDYSSG